ncbi:MAG TPA: sugar transferase [Sphingobacteriaceae bacterium]
MYNFFFKRGLDLFISIPLFISFLPIVILFGTILFFFNRGKVFFFQSRPGKDARLFTIIKLRTMNDRRDEKGNLLPDNERMTRIGLWVRRLSIDEIPQLLNVIKGDMSLIGPRPLLPEYVPLYDEFQARRHEVKPGITGWAQVNGRNSLSWREKLEMDVWYIDNISFLLDIKVLFLTVFKVLKREGINQQGVATMEKFNGLN